MGFSRQMREAIWIAIIWSIPHHALAADDRADQGGISLDMTVDGGAGLKHSEQMTSFDGVSLRAPNAVDTNRTVRRFASESNPALKIDTVLSLPYGKSRFFPPPGELNRTGLVSANRIILQDDQPRLVSASDDGF